MEGGPPGFPRDSSCPAVLGCRAQEVASPFAYGTFTPYGGPFQVASARRTFCDSPAAPRCGPARSRNPSRATVAAFHTRKVWAPPRSLATTSGISVDFFSLGVLRCFSSPGCPRLAMCSPDDTAALPAVGCPIRRSPDRRLLAATRGLSQLAASFIGSRRQGIHRAPLVA